MYLRATFGLAVLAVSLSGCGGGGGGGAPPAAIVTSPASTSVPSQTVIPPVGTAQSFRTTEYLRMGGLDQIRAADAYALGYTGQGVIIGIIDFNFNLASNDVNFNPLSVGADDGAKAIYAAQNGSAIDTDQHGQAVAATAAALKNNVGGQGVAFNATVLAVDFFSDVNDVTFNRGGHVVHVSDPFTYLTSHGARIINTSWGYESTNAINSSAIDSATIRAGDAYTLVTTSTAVLNGALLVTSAGNSGGTEASASNLDIADDLRSVGRLDSGPGAFIVAGAVDSNNVIASFSNRAGSLMNYYMVAPGVNLILPWNGGTASVSGTSFSAPMISGAAALIFQRWPNLTARDVANILFASATDLGAPGVDAVYGHGLLNLAAALQPLGVTTTAVSGSVAPTVAMTNIVLGPAFGDAPAFHRALAQVMILDGFGRDFEIDMSARAGSRPNLPDMFGVLEQRLGWRSTDFMVGEATSFSFDMRHNPEDGIVPFQSLAGPQDYLTHATTFRLTGVADGIGWMAGSGLSLHDGMLPPGYSAFVFPSLTNAFSPMVGAAPGAVAGLSVPIADDTKLSFGASFAENQGLTDHLRTPFRNSAQAASLRLDHVEGNTRFGLEIGDVRETGGFMGSLAAGGLTMAAQASTVWTTASAETALDKHWSLKGAMTLAATGGSHPQGSLITAIGPVTATSFALGVSGVNLWRSGDALSFTLAQPLRAEQGSLTLATGVGRDWSTGGVIMGQSQASLTPSGRELDFETGYSFSLAGWGVGANVAYAVDPNHVQGKNAVLALFTLSRRF